ncbi:MAG: SpoIIE family protein phosphatase [Firmicutes bacterium]|nr:SpoIIE family protein phosphatase [Bacillota bacterium]
MGLVEMPEADLSYFETDFLDTKTYCRFERVASGYIMLTTLPMNEVFASRNSNAYETAFADILLFTVVFLLIYILVQKIVVNNLDRINVSLAIITKGNLDETVNVRSSSEFASLSDDINLTVTALKGYIEQAEKRMEEELEFARQIQSSALPKNFKFPRDEFELFASMDPAKEVGGDFYDFFFVDRNKIALVIADVSGKGIPASLFMMRSKTAIKSLAESGRSPSAIFERANDVLCEGNDADMFVTAWIGIVDLETGKVQCANAGHEYPAIKRADGKWELFKDKHSLALAAMEGMPFKDYEMQLNEGDKLFVYTDGVPEAIDKAEEQFGTDRMLEALNDAQNIGMKSILPFVRKRISNFVNGADQFDDITMLGFDFKHKA